MAGNKRNLFFIGAVTPSLCILRVCDWIFIQKLPQKKTCVRVRNDIEIYLKWTYVIPAQETRVFLTSRVDLFPLRCVHIYSNGRLSPNGFTQSSFEPKNTLVVYMYPVEPNLCEFQTVASTSLQEYMGNWKTTAATGYSCFCSSARLSSFFTPSICVLRVVRIPVL